MNRPSDGLVERLLDEFGSTVSASEIMTVVDRCVRDLAGQVPAPARPEMTERLARARLTRLSRRETVA